MNYKAKKISNKQIRTISVCILLCGLILIICWAINPKAAPEWTGFSEYNTINYRTLWDWLDLIIIPGSIGLFAWIFTSYEKDKNKRIENEKFKDVTLNSFLKVMAELRSEEHTSELQSRPHLVCRLLLEKKKKNK